MAKVTAEYAIKNKDVLAGYNASKKLAEQAAWQFMEEAKPNFDLTVLNPNIVIGPMLHIVKTPEQVNATNAFAVFNFLNGEYKRIEEIIFPFYHFVRSAHTHTHTHTHTNTHKTTRHTKTPFHESN